jgi:hypothetical protein
LSDLILSKIERLKVEEDSNFEDNHEERVKGVPVAGSKEMLNSFLDSNSTNQQSSRYLMSLGKLSLFLMILVIILACVFTDDETS